MLHYNSAGASVAFKMHACWNSEKEESPPITNFHAHQMAKMLREPLHIKKIKNKNKQWKIWKYSCLWAWAWQQQRLADHLSQRAVDLHWAESTAAKKFPWVKSELVGSKNKNSILEGHTQDERKSQIYCGCNKSLHAIYFPNFTCEIFNRNSCSKVCRSETSSSLIEPLVWRINMSRNQPGPLSDSTSKSTAGQATCCGVDP